MTFATIVLFQIAGEATTKCMYWDFSMPKGGGWSSKGCTYNGTMQGRDICLCDHLTNFAVLLVGNTFNQDVFLKLMVAPSYFQSKVMPKQRSLSLYPRDPRGDIEQKEMRSSRVSLSQSTQLPAASRFELGTYMKNGFYFEGSFW